MSVLHDKAQDIANGLVSNQKQDGDEMKASPFLDFLMQLMTQLLPMLLACLPKGQKSTSAELSSGLKNLRLGQRLRLWQELRANGVDGQLIWPLHTEILKVAKNSTEEDAKAVLDEIA